MATALTGQLGLAGSQPGLVQLGGPAYAQLFDRSIPTSARPLIGHAYQNNGVTPITTFSVMNRPNIQATPANGGFNQVLLSVAAPINGLTQGNVVRLSEQGGDGSFIYGGIVEDLPDSIRSDAVEHQILLSPPAFELDDTYTQLVYTPPFDPTRMVRDAIALTNHLSCDQTSVPATSLIIGTSADTGTLDFRNQPVKQVLDTAAHLAGVNWFWYVDELFRVWFQAMGSSAVYTIPRAQYEERTKAASIQNRKNKVTVVGGFLLGTSINASWTADDLTSQGLIGTRALNPAISVPNFTNQNAVTTIATTILGILNRVWNRVNLKVLPTYGRRIHGSWPGGAMVRYWEPSVNPMQESAVTGSGAYSGPYIAQTVDNDGLTQKVTAGDIAVSEQADITNMVTSIVARGAANGLNVTAAALNSGQQILSGTIQSAATPALGPSSQWRLTPSGFQSVDPSGVVRGEIGNLPANGISPAQYGVRASDSGGTPIFDSAGLINVMASLGISSQGPGQTITSTSYTTTTPAITVTFTLTRTSRLLIPFFVTAKSTVAAKVAYARVNLVGVGQSGALKFGGGTGSMDVTNGFAYLICAPGSTFGALAAGTYTAQVEAKVDAGGSQYFDQGFVEVFQLGS